MGAATDIIWLVRVAGDGATARTKLRELAGPRWSRSTPEAVLDEHGIPNPVDGVWTSLSVWAAAEEQAARRWIDDVVSAFPDAFTARLTALSSRGEAVWGGDQAQAPWGEFASGGAEGAVVAVTSVGGDFGGIENALRFVAAVGATRHAASRAPGNLGAGIMFDLALPGDGLTVTIWESRQALSDWAYRGDTHPASMARTGIDWTLERTSFSRFAVEEMAGTWAPA